MNSSYYFEILEIKKKFEELKIHSVTKNLCLFTRHYLFVTRKATFLSINEALSLLHINIMKNSKIVVKILSIFHDQFAEKMQTLLWYSSI